MRDNQPVDPDLSGFVFDERFVAEAAHHEPTARERTTMVRQAERADRRTKRRRRRAEIKGRLGRGAMTTLVIGLLVAGLVWSFGGLGHRRLARPADRRPLPALLRHRRRG